MGFFYEDYLNNPDLKVMMTIPGGGKPVEALLINDFMFSGSSEYTNLMEQVAEAYISKIDVAKAMVLAAAPSQAVRLSKMSPRLIDQTILRWSGGGRPTFPISLMFIETKNGERSVRENVQRMYSTVFPQEGNAIGSGKISARTYGAPLGYIGTALEKSVGLISLKIGKWFLATGLVASGVNFTFSKEVTPDGGPLFATGDITLESYRIMTNDEVQKFFL